MKLKNSFLIAAGVFFFAVAFINFAKAGDDGGGEEVNPYIPEFNMRTVYDQDCTAYLWRKQDPDTGAITVIINTSEVAPGFSYVRYDSLDGKKDGCEYFEDDICFPSKCSAIDNLAFLHGI